MVKNKYWNKKRKKALSKWLKIIGWFLVIAGYVGAINDSSYTVGPGQIWTVEYIGDLQSNETACESGEVYNLEEEKCMARTALTFDFGGTETTTDEETGTVTVETEAVEYEQIDIQTHQDLEEDKKIAFTHEYDKYDKEDNTPNNFKIGEKTFSSKINRDGSVRVTYGGSSKTLQEKESVDLDEYVSVKLIKSDTHIDSDGIFDYGWAKYEFSIDNSFLDISIDEEEQEIKVNNSYMNFPGGITLTTTDTLDKTIVENIDKTLNKGTTTFNYEGDYREVKARPYFKIETPGYDYTLDGAYGDTTQPTIIDMAVKEYNKNPVLGIIILSGVGIFFIGSIYFIIKGLTGKKKRK